MKPMGLKPLKFPGKTKEWLGKGVLMWWENLCKCNKSASRQKDKRDIAKELLVD